VLKSEFVFPRGAISSPICVQCDLVMSLVKIDPDKQNHDRCSFECPGCREVVTEVMKYQ